MERNILSIKKKRYYLVIIGDTDNKRNSLMENKLQQINANKILDNTFIVSADDCNQLSDVEEVRNFIIGKELGYCIVLVLNNELISAWHLTKDNSDYFNNLATEINGK